MADKHKAAGKRKAAAKGKTPDELVAAGELGPEEMAKLKPVQAPVFYASTFRLQGSGNDFSLIFMRPLPMQNESGTIQPNIMMGETIAVVSMSPQSLKDLYVLIGGQLAQHEKDFGEIQTPFTTRMAKQKP